MYLAARTLGAVGDTTENPGAWAALENDEHITTTVVLGALTGFTINADTAPDGTNTVAYAGYDIDAPLAHAPISFAVTSGALPDGISMASDTGILSGTPTVPGIFTFTVTATDNFAQTDDQVFVIEIFALPSGGLGGWMAAVMDD
jgi:hypothetical protein